MSAEKFTDNTLMPFGKFSGNKMINVPAWYLVKIYESGIAGGQLKEYIKDNLLVLKKEMKLNAASASR